MGNAQKPLKSICPHARLKYDFPLGFHRELSTAQFDTKPCMLYPSTS
jgi:hypothetical protein